MIPKKKIQKYIKEGTKLSADSVLDILKDYPDYSFEVYVIGVFHRTFVFNYEDKDRIYVSDFSSAAEDYYLEEVEFLEYFGDYFIKLDQFFKVSCMTSKEIYDKLYNSISSSSEPEKEGTFDSWIICPEKDFRSDGFPIYIFEVSLHYSSYKPQISSYKDLYPYIHFKRLRDTFIPNSNLYGQFFRFTRDEFIKYMSTSKWIVLEEAKISL